MAKSASSKDWRGSNHLIYLSDGSLNEPVAVAVAADRGDSRRFGVSALVGLGVGVLAGCVYPPPAAPPQIAAIQPAPSPRAPSSPPHVFSLPPRKPTPPPQASAAKADVGSESALLSSSGLERTPSASELIGLDETAATQLFGSAAEQTDAAPAKIWRYRSANCELDLTFYLDLRTGKMRALNYAFKGPAGQQSCLRSLVVARRG